jgi:hypothetical protein
MLQAALDYTDRLVVQCLPILQPELGGNGRLDVLVALARALD